jgi:DNA-binding NarL/FixJ family response regulator
MVSFSDSQPIRLLTVDDNAPLLASLHAIFALEEGIDLVGEAADGRAGLEQAEALRPDVVLLDIEMPVMNGIEAGRLIKERLPATKLVYFAAEVIWRSQALALGADAFVLKESPVATVIEAIRRVARERTRPPLMQPSELLARLQDSAAAEEGARATRGERVVLPARADALSGQIASPAPQKPALGVEPENGHGSGGAG